MNMKPKPLKNFFVQYRKVTNKGFGRMQNSKWFDEAGADKFAMKVFRENKNRALVHIIQVDEFNPSRQIKYKFVDLMGEIQLWNDFYMPDQLVDVNVQKVQRLNTNR